MANPTTGIAWATGTSNPFKGCTQCSPECDHCYAVNWAKRHQAMETPGYENTVKDDSFTGIVGIVRKEFEKIRRVRSERLFVNSMSDTFHVAVSDDDIHGLFDAMAANTSGTNFLLCTKRAARLANMASTLPITSNMWIGVTVGCQKSLHRLDHLRKVPAAIRWVSVEPMLEPLDLTPWLSDGTLQWVVVGGESKKGFRPMQREWAQAILDQCRQHGVPFFLKQWSAFNPKTDVEYPPTLEGRVWHEFPALGMKASTNIVPLQPTKDPKRVAAAHKAWETMRARKAAAEAEMASNDNTNTEVPPDFGVVISESVPMGNQIAARSAAPYVMLDSPVSGGQPVRVPTSVLDQERYGYDAISFPRSKHVFWFERERLGGLRSKLMLSMVSETSEDTRRFLYEQIKEVEAYDHKRPKISPKKWTCFRRSDTADKGALIHTLNKLLTGLFSVTGGTSMWAGHYFQPFLWVQANRDATLLKLKGFVNVDGVHEVLTHIQKED